MEIVNWLSKVNIKITPELKELKSEVQQKYSGYISYKDCRDLHIRTKITSLKNRFGLIIYLFSQTDDFRQMLNEWEYSGTDHYHSHCICSHDIRTCNDITNIKTGFTVTIGLTCILKTHLINEAQEKQIKKNHRLLIKYKKACEDCGKYNLLKTNKFKKCKPCYWRDRGCHHKAIQVEMDELIESGICLFSKQSMLVPEI
jgi:hypothetical protein